MRRDLSTGVNNFHDFKEELLEKLLTEIYEESSVTFPLILWHSHYAGDVIFLGAGFFFGEIPHVMKALKLQ